jgi:hypothetical protein
MITRCRELTLLAFDAHICRSCFKWERCAKKSTVYRRCRLPSRSSHSLFTLLSLGLSGHFIGLAKRIRGPSFSALSVTLFCFAVSPSGALICRTRTRRFDSFGDFFGRKKILNPSLTQGLESLLRTE